MYSHFNGITMDDIEEQGTWFRYKVYDRKYGGEINNSMVRAKNRTQAREIIFKAARDNCDVPGGRNARDYGYVPLSDWRIVFTEELTSTGWKWIGR